MELAPSFNFCNSVTMSSFGTLRNSSQFGKMIKMTIDARATDPICIIPDIDDMVVKKFFGVFYDDILMNKRKYLLHHHHFKCIIMTISLRTKHSLANSYISVVM